MTNPPSGRLEQTSRGPDLVLSRAFKASIDDVWASVTEPERSARWFGRWTGDEPGPGRTIKVQMAYEEGAPWMEMRIEACEAPRRLAVVSLGEGEESGWQLEVLLAEAGDRTELRLIHHLTTTEGVGEVGPGWEYYLDMLVAAREDAAQPVFDDYYPSMKVYYEALRP
ncbi:SRPBCC family protein [Paractinoplanes lichenicola]|uniref:SRPBCC family protein n=1 Tax=Paractinoplanes lichenicola TaxID=2802976 RepID=A0ABS1VTD9_9ACTN|nr:SRPBCC family protein [Actinoplanes lichenicola]MBL7257737.1 SRPBCC family protein [Actinoplanes lichenicola]